MDITGPKISKHHGQGSRCNVLSLVLGIWKSSGNKIDKDCWSHASSIPVGGGGRARQ